MELNKIDKKNTFNSGQRFIRFNASICFSFHMSAPPLERTHFSSTNENNKRK